MSGVAPVRFVVVDALTWAAWFAIVSSVGFYAGDAALDWLSVLVSSQQVVLPLVVVVGIGVWIWRRGR